MERTLDLRITVEFDERRRSHDFETIATFIRLALQRRKEPAYRVTECELEPETAFGYSAQDIKEFAESRWTDPVQLTEQEAEEVRQQLGDSEFIYEQIYEVRDEIIDEILAARDAAAKKGAE